MKSFAYVSAFMALLLSFIFGLIWFFLLKDWAKISCFISLLYMVAWMPYFEKRGEN